MHKFPVVLLILLVASPAFLSLQPTHAQTQQTLAETIDNILSKIDSASYNSSWGVLYSQIFGLSNQSIFDSAVQQALNQHDYNEVVFIARLAELNGYGSEIVNSSLRTALTEMPMCGSLPKTYRGSSTLPEGFLLYDRYMLNAYRYASNLNVPGFDLNQAYNDFTKAYLAGPEKSDCGEMLLINPANNSAVSYSSRYYDEHAETLSMFLYFALEGINDSTRYADDAWINVQSHWNEKYYGYTASTSEVECEMGNFAMVASQYRNFRGDIPYFDRVVEDLEHKLLAKNFSSPMWGTQGVIKHSEGNLQNRLYETTASVIALQMLYPYFSEGNKSNFQSMLPQGWKNLVNSSLCNGTKFAFMDKTSEGEAGNYVDDASMLGAMTLFLYGIIPEGGYLAINATQERYQDYRTCFQTSQWRFDYANRSIRIPVVAGNLSFIFGSDKVTQNFISNGVYDIKFTADWNNITAITKISDVNIPQLSPVELQPVPKTTPTPSPQPTSSPTPTPTIPPTATPSPAPSTTPTPNPTATSTPEPSATPLPKRALEQITWLVVAGIALIIITVGTIGWMIHKRRRLSHF